MKLINEKRFLTELYKNTEYGNTPKKDFDWVEIEYGKFKQVLSKHLKDLPEKKTLHIKGRDIPNQHLGYNQCLEDIEKV
ncbi:hypothetical protein LCGC14_0615410 [marine sediment metagenome]|uniref:Uncharacterized protein n=1 Tax=marine sediment metagenome TaxID=412755 RepID=A0A0F9TST8_9ZZZZ|nr:hypothetical protein [bacterium]